jgi:hypothetical protein
VLCGLRPASSVGKHNKHGLRAVRFCAHFCCKYSGGLEGISSSTAQLELLLNKPDSSSHSLTIRLCGGLSGLGGLGGLWMRKVPSPYVRSYVRDVANNLL